MVFCCVGNDDDLRAVTIGPRWCFAGMKPGAIFVDHTTASANVARELATWHARKAFNSSMPRIRWAGRPRKTACSP